MAFLAILAGVILLAAGAESLVRGASTLARRFNISSLVIGLTVVAWGTSAPELATSIQSALDGQTGLSFGNVIGSNTFNVLVILAICALLTPISVSIQVVRSEIPIMILVSAILFVMAADGSISLIEALLLLLGLVLYTILQASLARIDQVREAAASPRSHVLADILFILAGLAVLVLGARILVFGAVTIARSAGVGPEVIGLTIVAAGTSLPEVATSIAGILRGERDIAIGNIIGSNIFNILGVLSISALVVPNNFLFDTANLPDVALMLAAALVCLPICISGLQISRIEGSLLLLAYVAYLTLIVIRALDPATILSANAAILAGAIILPTCAMLLAVLERPFRERPRRNK